MKKFKKLFNKQMSTVSDKLYTFVETTPKIFVTVEAHTKIQIIDENRYHMEWPLYKKIFSKKFELPDLKVTDLSDHKLSVDLKYNEYKKSEAKNKIFKVSKNVVAPYKLIEQIISDRLNSIEPSLARLSSTISITFEKENWKYKIEESSIFYSCLCCFSCSELKKFSCNLDYKILKTEEEWRTFWNTQISKDDIKEFSF